MPATTQVLDGEFGLRSSYEGKIYALGIPVQRISEIANGKRGISPHTAWVFASAFCTTPEFWMNMQAAYDLSRNRPSRTILRLGARPAHTGTVAKSSLHRRASAA